MDEEYEYDQLDVELARAMHSISQLMPQGVVDMRMHLLVETIQRKLLAA